jgi:hypothetical protein
MATAKIGLGVATLPTHRVTTASALSSAAIPPPPHRLIFINSRRSLRTRHSLTLRASSDTSSTSSSVTTPG